MNRISPDQLIEAARVVAGQSRDQYATPLYRVLVNMPCSERDQRFINEMGNRMGLVMESFLIGAAMTLKLLHGDGMPEPYERTGNHRERLRDLLAKYELLRGGASAGLHKSPGSQIPEPSSATSSTKKIGE